MAFKPTIIPVELSNGLGTKNLESEGVVVADSNYYFQTEPPNVEDITVASSVNIRMPLYRNSSNAYKNMVSLEYLYRDGNSDDVAQVLVKGGAINKAIKYALLYNYFGYPVANIQRDTGDVSADPLDLDSYQFVTQNPFDYKPFLYGFSYASENSLHLKTGYGTAGISTKQVYQFGKIGSLPNFGSIASFEELKEASSTNYELGLYKTFEDLDNENQAILEGKSLRFDIFDQLHGSYNGVGDGWGNQTFVDMIGFSPENSVFHVPVNQPNSLFVYEPNTPVQENLDELTNKLTFGLDHEHEYILLKDLFQEIGVEVPEGDNWTAKVAEILAENPEVIDKLDSSLFDQPYGYFDKENFILDAVAWKKTNNPINRSYCRAWLPSLQQNRKASVDLLGDPYGSGPDDTVITYGAGDTDYVPGADLLKFSYGQNYRKVQNKNAGQDYNLTWKGSYALDVNTLGMILGQYGSSAWFSYVNNNLVTNEALIDEQGEAWEFNSDAYLGYSYTKFSKDNIASQYKIVPGTKILDGGGNSGDLNDLNYYLQNPARTLNDIAPYLMKYIASVVPIKTDSVAADEWNPENLSQIGINSADVITNTTKVNLTPQDFLRKFRFSTEDMSTYSSDDEKNALGYTHVVGDLGSSGENLGLSKTRNRLFVATPSIAQREYLTYASLQGTYIKAEANRYVKNLPFDKNFIYSPSFNQKQQPVQFLAPNLSKKLADLKKDGTNEFNLSYRFSEMFLSQMFFKLPPYFFKMIEENPEIADLYSYSANGFDTNFGIPVNLTYPDNLWNSAEDISTAGFLVSLFQGGTAAKQILSLGNNYGGPNVYGPPGFGSITFPKSLYPSYEATEIIGGQEAPKSMVNFLNDIGDIWLYGSGHDVGSKFYFKVINESELALPVWNYTNKDIKKIDWNTIQDYPQKVSDLQLAINENDQIASAINYGIPEWVRGLRIYPSLHSDTTVTNLRQPEFYDDGIDVVLANNQAPVIEGSGNGTVLLNYKTSNSKDIKNKIIPGFKLVIEPELNNNTDGFYGFSGVNAPLEPLPNHKSYAELKYAVEIDIDERKLLLDLASQGVISFAGEVSDYESLGFDIEELLLKSNGNVVSDSLKYAFEELLEGIKIGQDGYDFSAFPSLVKDAPLQFCLDSAPPDVVAKAQNIKDKNPEDPYACTSYVCLNETGAPSAALKSNPGKDSRNIGYLSDKTVVKVLKEWVNGKGEYNKVLVVDKSSPQSGSVGYIHPSVLKEATGPNETSIFFENVFGRSLAQATVQARSEMSKALSPSWWKIPLNSIAETSEPFLDIENGEVHYPVTLDTDCIVDEKDFEDLRQQALRKGLRELFTYYDKKFDDNDIENFINSYLAVRIEDDDFYVDARPGSKVMMLLKVGSVYLNAVLSKGASLEDLKQTATKLITLNTSWYQAHLQQAVNALNKLYIDVYSSQYRVSGFNFFKESRRLAFVPVVLKKLLAANGYNTNPQQENVFNIGFDDSFNVLFVTYKEKNGQERLLNIGFDHYKNTEPFAFPYTMSLLYHHRQLKNPLLKWQIIFKEWLPDPKPKIIPKGTLAGDFPTSRCSPWMDWSTPLLSQLWDNALGQLSEALDLDPRYDLGAFQFNLLQYFPPCPKPAGGKGPGFLNFATQIDGQTTIFTEKDFVESITGEVNKVGEYIGDWLSSGKALEELQTKIFDMDDVWNYILNYITPELLYSKICKCFIDLMDVDDISIPNLEINATGGSGGLTLNPSTFGKNPKEAFDYKGPDVQTSFQDEDGNLKNWKDWDRATISAEDLYCSFCFRMPSVFLRLPSTDILAELINAIKALLEFALAQLIMQLIKSLIEILLTCPELNCGPEENVGRVEDFGRMNLDSLMGPDLIDYGKCGLLIDGVKITKSDVQSMLVEISNSLTTTEVLGLVDGSATNVTMRTVNQIVSKYDNIRSVFTNPAIIEDFFLCAGSNIDPNYLNEILDETTDLFQDPTVCTNFKEEAKQKLLDKCGNVPNAVKMANKTLNHDINKYKKIARIIRENDDLSNQLPPLFSDGKGTQSILSGIKFDTLDYSLDQIIDTASIPIETVLNLEANQFVNPLSNIMVKDDGGASLYNLSPKQFLLFEGLGVTDKSNKLAGLASVDEEGNPVVIALDDIMKNISAYSNGSNYTYSLSSPDGNLFSRIRFNQPATKDGELIYTNNFTIEAQRPDLKSGNKQIEGNLLQFNGSNKEFPTDIKDFIDQKNFELYSTQVPEQIQVFVQMMKDAGGVGDLLDNSTLETIYDGILSNLTFGIEGFIGEPNILKDFNVSPVKKIDNLNDAIIKVAVAAMAGPLGFAAGAAAKEILKEIVKDNYPELTRNQIENVNLASLPVKQAENNPYAAGIINFQKFKEIVKEAYDFTKETDERSGAIQVGQKAFARGYIYALLQVFSGQVFAKALYYLPYFPYEVFSANSELLVEYIFDVFETDWLNKSAPAGFSKIWKNLVCRLLADQSEFTPDSGFEKLPQLPGESNEQHGHPTKIKGTVYDISLGVPVRIENWKDATKYFIRQCYVDPLRFIKNQTQATKLKNDLVVNAEISPFEFLSYQKIKEIHDKNLNFQGKEDEYSSSSPLNPSLALGNPEESPFKEGRFLLQQYIELEELEQFVEGQYTVGGDQIETELYNPAFINRDPDLKGKLNSKQFAKLVEILVPSDPDASLGFGFDDKFKGRELKDFFKSIKIGLRFCYGINHYNMLEDDSTVPDFAKSVVDQLVNAYQSLIDQQKLVEDFSDTILNDKNQALKEFTNYIRKDKSFIIFENVKTDTFDSTVPGVYYTYTEQELEQAFFESEKGDALDAISILIGNPQQDKDKNIAAGFDIETLVEKTKAKLSFVFPLIARSQDVSNTSFFNKKLYDIADSSIGYEQYMESLREFLQRPSNLALTQNLLISIAGSTEYRALFGYIIPVPEIINLYLLFFNTVLDTDGEVNQSFLGTKNLLADNIKSIYDLRGQSSYKNQPSYITDKGGPKGIAQSSTSSVKVNKP